MNDTLKNLYETVLSRRDSHTEGSYTCYLFDKGLDKILKKVGEECAETIIAAKNGRQEETVGEISDLIYHLTVMMAQQNIPLEAVLEELDRRIQDLATRGIAMAPGQGLADLMAYRGPLYEKYADLIVDCLPGQTLAQTTGAVLDCLSQDLSAPAHGVNVGQTAAIRLRSESEKEGSNDIS